MSQIILDFGSGNTCKNNRQIVEAMIDELKKVDTHKHEVIIKWQLFICAGDNVPLLRSMFGHAYEYAAEAGYKTTASVFDKLSVSYLLEHDVPFVKIANNRNLDYLIGEIPRKIPVYISYDDIYKYYEKQDIEYGTETGFRPLLCVSKYPATINDYLKLTQSEKFAEETLFKMNISDHTIGLDLFKKYKPEIWEKHFKLPDSTGLDAGPFAITPELLKEIL